MGGFEWVQTEHRLSFVVGSQEINSPALQERKRGGEAF